MTRESEGDESVEKERAQMTLLESDLSSFGALLKRFRTRRHLTQQRLAEALGVHRHAIGRWEQGEHLPATKAMVLELARHLHLDDQETRQLLEVSLTALAPSFLVPLPRNLCFTGREEILETLHAQLGVDQTVALTQSSALHGLGGVGKTQIALEYAYRHALEYRAVFWIGAETEEQIVASLLHIAETLQLPEREDKDQQRVVAAVQRWLISHSQWLLIWDNVEDLALLERFLPSTRSGAILLTTRYQALGSLARCLDLLPMEQEEGILFLLRRTKVLSPEATSEQVRQLATRVPAQYAAASELVTVLGGLPLALDQAGAYLEETQCGLPAYLDLFRTRRAVLLQQRGERSRAHPASVSTTFMLAITAIAQRSPAVGDLLQVCALLQPDAVPEEIFRQGGKDLGATLSTVCGDALEWDRVVGVACSYSLLSRQPEEQTLSMHRLVQAVLLDTLTEEEREQETRRVIKVLDAMFPEVRHATEYTIWKQCERLLPHALLCLNRTGTADKPLAFASLAYKVAQYLRERGRYEQAEPLYQRALALREQVLEPGYPDVVQALNGLAILYSYQGKYAEAEPLYQRALALRERTVGPHHPLMTVSLNNLANLYLDQGKYAEAEPLYQRALHISEQILGPDHLDVARPLNNLAELYRMQGKYVEAEPLYRRALHTWEHHLDPDHPLVAYSLNNLAELAMEQGEYIEAEPLFLRALQIGEQVLGPDHPEVVHPLNNLAELYRMQGKYVEAEPLYRRALHILNQALGPDHPRVAGPLNGLANLSREQGKYAEAEALYQHARSIREQSCGQEHPETAETLHDLATFRQKQGKGSEALSFAKRALSIRSQTLGDVHPKTVATRKLYAQLVQEQARTTEETAGEQGEEGIPGACNEEHQRDKASHPLHREVDPSASENDPLQGFLDACCELHPRAWCRISELWQAYEQWTVSVQQYVPLSRRAFAAQLKARGCRSDRTSKVRIWRGIRLRDKTT